MECKPTTTYEAYKVVDRLEVFTKEILQIEFTYYLSAFFNSINNDFINGYIIAPDDNYFVVSSEGSANFSQLNFFDNASEYYIDLTKRNPSDVVVQGPIVSPRTHEINVFNRQAIYIDGKYWGYVGVIVDFYKLLECMRLNAEDNLYVYSIKSVIQKGNSDFIWGDSSLFKHSNMVYRQKSVFFGKQRWDFALKLKNIGKTSFLHSKISAVLIVLYLLTLVLTFYLLKFYYALKKSSNIDPVTATMVHDKFVNYVDYYMKDNAEHGVIVLELIHFNQINACYDIKIGDALLCEVTRRIRSVISYNDVVCRIGTEFIIFMKNISSNVDVDKVQGELSDVLERTFSVSNLNINLKSVLGSSSTISKGRDFYEIMGEIDSKLLDTKRNMKFFSREGDRKSL